jgi:hypothetical protein
MNEPADACFSAFYKVRLFSLNLHLIVIRTARFSRKESETAFGVDLRGPCPFMRRRQSQQRWARLLAMPPAILMKDCTALLNPVGDLDNRVRFCSGR